MVVGIIHLGVGSIVNFINFCQIDYSVVLWWIFNLFSEVLLVFDSSHLSGFTVVCSRAHRHGPSSFKCRILLWLIGSIHYGTSVSFVVVDGQWLLGGFVVDHFEIVDLFLVNFWIQFLVATTIGIVHRGFQGRSVADLIRTAHLMELFKLWHERLILCSSCSLGSNSAIQLIILIAHLCLRGRHLSSKGFTLTRSLGGNCNLLFLLWRRVSIHSQGSPVLSIGFNARVCSLSCVLRLETPLQYFGVVRRILVDRVVDLAAGVDGDPELAGVLVGGLLDVLDLLGLIGFVRDGGVLLGQLQVLVAAVGDLLWGWFRHLFAQGHRHAPLDSLIHLHWISLSHIHCVHSLIEILILRTLKLVLWFVNHRVQVYVNCFKRFLLPFWI